jgi:ribosome maturation factor RimP
MPVGYLEKSRIGDEEGVMREDSRRGAPRQARAAGRSGSGRDPRARNPSGRGSGAGNPRSGPPGSRPGGQGAGPARVAHPNVDTARLTALIEPVLHAMDIDLEAVKVSTAGRRRVLLIIVDADGGVSLDDIAEVSREVSARLDSKDAMGDAPYTLEVSSPGVDRPLTQPRHWRRAIGRLVIAPVTGAAADGGQEPQAGPADLEARVIDADEDHVTLEIDGALRVVSYGDLGPGRVQIEFGRLPDVDDLDEAAGPQDLGDFEESWDGPYEEGPDGH